MTLRPDTPDDEAFLWEMLYEAVFSPPGLPRPSRDILLEPAIAGDGSVVLRELVVVRTVRVEIVLAVKEASGNLAQIGEIIRHRPARFSVLSGDDPLTLQVMADGGDGVISVTSNAAPAVVAQLTELCAAGDFAAARAVHHRLAEWTAAAFVESNPIPAKAALAMMGKMANVVRLPLVPLAEKFEPTVRAALASVGALTA